MKPFCTSILAIFLNSLIVVSLFAIAPATASAAEFSAVVNDATSTGEALTDPDADPNTCIDVGAGIFISATALSMLPIKNISVIFDLIAHSANLGLKHCVPVLTVPPNKAIDPLDPPSGVTVSDNKCAVAMRIPLPQSALDQLILDKQIIDLVVNDPTIELPIEFALELRKALDSEYGHLSNQLTGEYSNIMGITLPFLSPASQASYWGDVGKPGIKHFNSDVLIALEHGGERLDKNKVEFQTGSHSLRWTADTLIEGADLVWIPDLSNVGPWEKPAKKKTFKETVKGWIKAAKKAAKDTYTDIAKNGAKKTKKKIAKAGKNKLRKQAITSAVGYVLDNYFLAGYTHNVTSRDVQFLYIIDHNAPTITGNEPIQVEALEPGGITSGRHIHKLMELIVVTDDCDLDPTLRYSTPRFWPLSLQEDGSSIPSEIIWRAEDNGAATATGGRNKTEATQQVMVVDTKPPIVVAPPARDHGS
ncbi:hypothetical protein KFU94_40090 [Chloroflexi bacterium TSY]|nr:hypothetical protein [Chloroflexi bacterium TSY]